MLKVDSTYSIEYDWKFTSIEEADTEALRIRALGYRMRKENKDIHFTLGVSVTNSSFMGYMGHSKPKNQGGKKEFVCTDRVKKTNHQTGEVIRVMPEYRVKPHVHILVYGLGASYAAEQMREKLKKKHPELPFGKKNYKTAEDIAWAHRYVEEQSTILYHV